METSRCTEQKQAAKPITWRCVGQEGSPNKGPQGHFKSDFFSVKHTRKSEYYCVQQSFEDLLQKIN